ncbi:ATP-binding cassette sub-family D member 4-like protein [Pilobolus umbonatus]|nr:ATP-binding cassette sub-family D member 4-like protein [Pilobolus umbonatus]
MTPMLDDIEPQSEDKKKPSYSFDRLFLSRFCHLLRILFHPANNTIHRPWASSKEARKTSLFWLYITFIAIGVSYEILVYFVGLIPSQFYSILTSKDLNAFARFILPCLLTVFAVAVIKSLLNFMGGLFALKSRRLLTTDQRITQDIDKFSETLRQIVSNLIIAPLMVIYYTWQCWAISGFVGPLLIYLYFIVGSILSRKFIKPIVNAVFFKESQEGHFRYFYVRLRQYCESIAFCEGEKNEYMRADKNLESLLSYQRNIVNKELPLRLINENFAYLGSILSYLIIAIPIFFGPLKDKDPSELSAIISKNSFMAMYLIYLFTTIIEQSSKLSDLAGYTARIGELIEAINNVNDELEERKSGINRKTEDMANHIVFENVTIGLPGVQSVVNHLNLSIKQGDHVALVGPNGCGKTSVLRALANLWPVRDGMIHLPKMVAGRDIIYLPQLPYLIYGSLRDQIVYPGSSASIKISDQEVIAILTKVRLTHLLGIVQSYDTMYEQEWSKFLSPGEQQRLVFARLFYWKPRVAVLDEASSAMDEESEEYLYRELLRTKSTVISVTHHSQIIQLHSTVVRIDGSGGFSIDNNALFTI